MKYLILVGDGMGDFPVAELAGRTPLEAAAIPAIDELCQKSEFFLTHTVPEGFPPGSDVANMSLMGFDPAVYYTGRAPLEAAAMGIHLAPDETAFRCNLVTLDPGENDQVTMRDFCAGHISNQEAHTLIADLEAACATATFHFKPGVSYRHLVVFKGEHPGIVTVPPHDHIEKDVTAYWQNYRTEPAWKELLDKAGAVLAEHPVNLARIRAGKNPATQIWLWGEGKMPSMPTLPQRFGISGSMISAVDLLKGLGVVGGLTVVNVPGATGYIDTNYEGKAQAACDALRNQDFVFVHLEAPDEAGHQGSLTDKLTAIEDFDRRIVRPIITNLRNRQEAFRVIVTMDHFTPLALRTHVSDPVPTLLYDSREVKKGSGLPFSEKTCRKHDAVTGNRLAAGHQLIEKLLRHE
ncbi:MAG: cofactor-independent phosphoglycerate mutase [Proteobacteria bacterium]|nr:cofactor-independent phosphoglycerate mutase [Pseudomonadota bacterium]